MCTSVGLNKVKTNYFCSEGIFYAGRFLVGQKQTNKAKEETNNISWVKVFRMSITTCLLRSDIHFETQSPRSGSSQSAGLPVHFLEATPKK